MPPGTSYFMAIFQALTGANQTGRRELISLKSEKPTRV
jgi:hypothetical protein